jgi:predicted DNA binding CopG/RHH family protein
MSTDEFDLNDLLSDDAPKKSGKKLQSNLRRAATQQGDVTKAKGRKSYGQDQEVRKTIYLPDELIEEVDATASRDGIPLMKLYRILVEAGMERYKNGEIVIEFQEEVVIKKNPTWRSADT